MVAIDVGSVRAAVSSLPENIVPTTSDVYGQKLKDSIREAS